MLTLVGETLEGHKIVSGIYRFYETTGLPLDVTLEFLRAREMVPDWPAFILEAVEAGMSPERALSMLDAAIADSYGSTFRDVVVTRLRLMLEKKSPSNPTVSLHVLPSEHQDLVRKLYELRVPSYDETMVILSSVVGQETVRRLIGERIKIVVDQNLPADRVERL